MPTVECPVDGCDWESQDLGVEFAAALTAALQIHDKAAHPAVHQAPPKLKLESPSIAAGCDPDQWSAFTRQWNMYKAGMSIADNVIPTALFYCCDADLRTNLMRDIQGDVAQMAEADLLGAIKRLAVKDESTLVHRIKLNRMTQSPGLSIRTFLANLRGQAALCQYQATCKEPLCTHVFDYSDEIIKDNLIRGIADPEILSDLLGDPKTDRTLEETVSFIAQKEQSKVTRSAVGADSVGVVSATPARPKSNSTSGSKCWACGGPVHANRNDRKARARLCEAWTFTCTKCHVKGHFSSFCSKCTSCGTWGHRDATSRNCPQHTSRKPSDHNSRSSDRRMDINSTGYVYDQLCSASEDNLNANIVNHTLGTKVDHHVFDGRWIAKPSKPHPMLTVTVTPLHEDHKLLGHPIQDTSRLKSIDIAMVADTGCQSSIMPLQTVLGLGITRQDLLPVKLVMRGAIQEDLNVIGAVIVSVETQGSGPQKKSTKLMCYVSDVMSKAFLCREALESLGIVHPAFPDCNVESELSITTPIVDSMEAQCSCPRRVKEPPKLPASLPPGLSGTEENVDRLREWLLDYYGATTFNVCEHQQLPLMTGEPLQLHIDPDATPVAIHSPALVPIHWQEKVHADLERDVRIGVLEKVPPNTPTTWCSRMVVTSKADGTPRRTVDLQPLNKCSVRQTHHVPSPFHLADQVPQNTKKTVTDAWNGYHSVPLREEDRHFTTFITPWGRYRYKVAPQGFLASGDAYNHRFHAIISDFANKVKCVDDTCMWEKSVEAAFIQTCQWLDLCARNGITLNPQKFQFAQDTVDFAGLTITPTNICPSAKFLDAIRDFPVPTDITGARAWFGLINQGAYAFAMTKQMKPFRALLKPSTKFTWNDDLTHTFEKSKEIIIQEMRDGVRLFDPDRLTCLSTDWSVEGIGFFLMQKYCDCLLRTPACCPDGWKLCLVGSRFTHPAESRYAPIEGEALAVAYALHQTRYYVLGCKDLLVATDHKPLLQILNNRSLTEIDNRRLLNLKEKTLGYRFSIIHVAGKKNLGPDAVSRYPAGTPDRLTLPGEPSEIDSLDVTAVSCRETLASLCQHSEDEDIANDTAMVMEASQTLYAVSNVVTWDMVRESTASDPTLVELMNHIISGFPTDCRELAVEHRPYYRYAASLCVVDGVVLLGQGIVIPPALRGPILDALHSAHQGVSVMRARANDTVYWPDINVDIARVRDQCMSCHQMAKSNPMQPPSDIKTPEYPFQMICADYFTFNNTDYVVVVDRYSNWPMVFKSESGADGLIRRLRETFVTFGIPEELTSDGGPQFTAGKTQEFLRSWGVNHRLTSVANPHANCRAELAVKTVKRMLMDNTTSTGSLDIDKFQRAMLTYRNSIDPDTKASPALILFGRPIRDAIPILMGRYSPHETWKELMSHRELALAKRHSREHEKWSEHTRKLPPLRVGDHVFLQNLTGNHPRRWDRTGTVVEVKQFHQYVVRVDGTGRVTLRNRQHLRKFIPYNKRVDPLQGLDHDPSASTRVDPATVTRNPVDHQSNNTKVAMPPTSPTRGPPIDLPVTRQDSQTQIATPPTSPIRGPPPSLPVSNNNLDSPVDMPPPAESDPPNSPVEIRTPTIRLPRALQRLQPYNKPGTKELSPPARAMRRPNIEH